MKYREKYRETMLRKRRDYSFKKWVSATARVKRNMEVKAILEACGDKYPRRVTCERLAVILGVGLDEVLRRRELGWPDQMGGDAVALRLLRGAKGHDYRPRWFWDKCVYVGCEKITRSLRGAGRYGGVLAGKSGTKVLCHRLGGEIGVGIWWTYWTRVANRAVVERGGRECGDGTRYLRGRKQLKMFVVGSHVNIPDKRIMVTKGKGVLASATRVFDEAGVCQLAVGSVWMLEGDWHWQSNNHYPVMLLRRLRAPQFLRVNVKGRFKGRLPSVPGQTAEVGKD